MIYRNTGIFIPRKYKNEKFYDNIKNNLTRLTKSYQNSPVVELKFYIEDDNYLLIPRYFPLEDYCDLKITDKLPPGKDINISTKIELRDNLQKSVVDFINSNNKGIIQAPPGSGKTVMSIKTICDKKKKTLILVHRDSLVEQWIERFLQFTDIQKSSISRLKSSTVEDNFKSDIVVTTNQTFVSLLNKDRIRLLKLINESDFGVLIADEIHTTVGAPTFSLCSIHIPCKETYGLSATPYRNDGTSDIINYHLGDIFVPNEEASVMKANVTVIMFSFKILKDRKRYLFWGGSFQRARYLNMLRKSKPLEILSKNLLEKFIKDDRKIIFVSERINFINQLYDSILSDDKSKFISNTGNEALEKQVTFATPGKIRDGVDAASKDCLILTSPISNIEQMTGRILRIKEGKATPIVVDMVDIDVRHISRTLFSRLDYYKNKKWNINFLYIDDNLEKHILTYEEAMRKII
jgi:superfamily II DNA or RNA helicase